MQLPDVNVLIYAHREDASEHPHYTAWLRALTASAAPFALSEVVLAGFLRVVTNRELITTDSDFARFPGLRWGHPLRPRTQVH
jgi:predicted nucleic acid-binding protein